MLKRVGRCPVSTHSRNGMITQYMVVRNALLDAVVSVSPQVLHQYEKYRNTPRIVPFAR